MCSLTIRGSTSSGSNVPPVVEGGESVTFGDCPSDADADRTWVSCVRKEAGRASGRAVRTARRNIYGRSAHVSVDGCGQLTLTSGPEWRNVAVAGGRAGGSQFEVEAGDGQWTRARRECQDGASQGRRVVVLGRVMRAIDSRVTPRLSKFFDLLHNHHVSHRNNDNSTPSADNANLRVP